MVVKSSWKFDNWFLMWSSLVLKYRSNWYLYGLSKRANHFKKISKITKQKQCHIIESLSMWDFEIGFFLQYNSLKNNKNETRNKFVWCIQEILPLIYHKIYFLLTGQWSTIFHKDNNPILPTSCLSLNIIAYIWNINYVLLKGESVKRLWQVGKNGNIFISVCFGEQLCVPWHKWPVPKMFGIKPYLAIDSCCNFKMLLSLLWIDLWLGVTPDTFALNFSLLPCQVVNDLKMSQWILWISQEVKCG